VTATAFVLAGIALGAVADTFEDLGEAFFMMMMIECSLLNFEIGLFTTFNDLQ
jgi:hypothetical protein